MEQADAPSPPPEGQLPCVLAQKVHVPEGSAPAGGHGRDGIAFQPFPRQFNGAVDVVLHIVAPEIEDVLEVIPTKLDFQQARARELGQPLPPDRLCLVVVGFRLCIHEDVVAAQVIVVLSELGHVLAPGIAILRLLDLPYLACQRADDLAGDLVLQRPRVGLGLVEALRPHMLARFAVDQLGDDAHHVGILADAAFKHIVDIEIFADLADVGGLALVGEGRVASHHREIGGACKHGNDVFAHPATEIAEAGIAAHIVEGEHGYLGYSGLRNRQVAFLPAEIEPARGKNDGGKRSRRNPAQRTRSSKLLDGGGSANPMRNTGTGSAIFLTRCSPIEFEAKRELLLHFLGDLA